jgi:nucleoside-diphosphate-sugar epimerase
MKIMVTGGAGFIGSHLADADARMCALGVVRKVAS